MKGRPKTTPIRSSLRKTSTLRGEVEDGIGALDAAHRKHLDDGIRGDFVDSLDLDEAMREGHEQENRWDYLLGHTPTETLVGLEPHSAKQDQVSTVIRKKEAAMDQLRGHLKPGARVAAGLWVASGKVFFADTEKERRRLDQKGIRFVGRRVLGKHLPAAKTRTR